MIEYGMIETIDLFEMRLLEKCFSFDEEKYHFIDFQYIVEESIFSDFRLLFEI